MQTLVDFLRDYWQYISFALVVFLNVLILILKRKPKKYDTFVDAIQALLAKIPSLMVDAEATGLNGTERRDYVFSWSLECLEQYMLKRDLTDSEFDYFYKTVSWFIEQVMNAPTKKGGCGREEVK